MNEDDLEFSELFIVLVFQGSSGQEAGWHSSPQKLIQHERLQSLASQHILIQNGGMDARSQDVSSSWKSRSLVQSASKLQP